MIARVWSGVAPKDRANAYEAQLKPEPLPGLSDLSGYLGSLVLRRDETDEVHFTTILFWESLDAVKAVAGNDFETAIVPEKRRANLLRYDAKASHYDVVASSEIQRLLPR